MGKDWDSLDGEAWRVGGGFSKPGIGDRPTAWASFGAADTANATCATCGGRMRGARKCECAEPDWRVKGKPLEAAGSRQAQGRKMQAWHEAWATEALRVLKPGGHLLAFGGTRTYHRLACAIEDAGFEIRDTIAWLYGSGFPKSLDVSKAIASGGGRPEDIRRLAMGEGYEPSGRGRVNYDHGAGSAMNGAPGDVPLSPDAERWQGWGTALKPAHEPVVVARKPLGGTVAANVLAHGTGALNVDGCRIAGEPVQAQHASGTANFTTPTEGYRPREYTTAGRWPANVVLDPEAAEALDRSVGPRSSGSRAEGVRSGLGYRGANGDGGPAIEGSTGPVSRFFYVAKASSAERNAGLDGFEAAITDDGRQVPIDNPYLRGETTRRNVHPTVKPIALMRWLVRLVTPPGGLILDPFAGSGTTGIAAVLEGFRFVGIEREAEYAAIACARIAWWSQHPDGVEIVKALEAERTRTKVRESGQESLFG